MTTLALSSLAACEQVIEAGQKTFVEVGQALLKIREARFYKTTHATFEDYCRERWGWERHYANRLIASVDVVKNLVPIGTIPQSESVIRPLTRLAPDQQRAVWEKANERAASEDRPVTARDVGEMVVEVVPPQERKQQRSSPFKMPSRAMFQARGAINLLEEILPGDGERINAITTVRDWCEKQLDNP